MRFVQRSLIKFERVQFMSDTLPQTGFVRLPVVLKFFPVSKSSWWSGIKSGRFPKGHKLSARVTAWKAEDIHALIKSSGSN
ncbi:helix-turn-helix transcriptional regulator [Herbaspirillum rubrisubalbicans]|uniref:helix-turn-helix transcriptional regulator n=1 Tax=Herbaspirillum TaxID=963 RepID=UPI000A94429E|nr:AlpA family phage regulatory protein [Herbaspirillum rubrisubalbicans]